MPGPKRQTREGLFSRRDAAVQLRITVATLRSLQNKGVIRGTFDKKRRSWWFTAEEIAECRAYRDAATPPRAGELSARLFEHFEADTPLRKIVTELRVLPEEVLRQRAVFEGGLAWIFRVDEIAEFRREFSACGLRLGEDSRELLPALRQLVERDQRAARVALSD